MDRVEVTALVSSLALIALVIELVRRRSLREEYALLWLFMGGMVLVLSLWRDLLHRFSALVGVYYPPSALFVLGFGIVLLILLHFSTVISVLTAENKTLAQRLALLAWRVEQLEGRHNTQTQPRKPWKGDVAGPTVSCIDEVERGKVGTEADSCEGR